MPILFKFILFLHGFAIKLLLWGSAFRTVVARLVGWICGCTWWGEIWGRIWEMWGFFRGLLIGGCSAGGFWCGGWSESMVEIAIHTGILSGWSLSLYEPNTKNIRNSRIQEDSYNSLLRLFVNYGLCIWGFLPFSYLRCCC